MSNLMKELFGGAPKRSVAALLAEVEGPRVEEPAPEYELSKYGKRLAHLKAAARELVPWYAGAVGDASRQGALSQQAAVLRTLLVLLGFALCVAMVGIVWMANRLANTRVVPYVVQVDRHGFLVPIGPADRDVLQSPRQAMAALAQWVAFFRTVTADARIQDEYRKKAFFFATPKSIASQKMREDYAKSPRPDGTGRRVDVDVVRVAQMGSGHTYSIEWTETASDAQAEHVTKSLYTAAVTIAVSPTEELDHVIVNPAGVFLKDFSITKLQ